MKRVSKPSVVRHPSEAAELDAWAARFTRRSVKNGNVWTLADAFAKSPDAKRNFVQLCKDGCDPEWLAKSLMRFPAWDSGRDGRKPFAPSAAQMKVFKRVLRDLKTIRGWESFPVLIEPWDSVSTDGMFFKMEEPRDYESMSFKVGRFEESLRSTIELLPNIRGRTNFVATNSLALAACETIRGIERQTNRPHFTEALILFDTVLLMEGRTDLLNSISKLKKLVKRYSRLITSPKKRS